MIEIIKPGTHYDFIGKWKWYVTASLALIAIGLAAIPLRGLRWGLDFAGGTELQVHFGEGVQGGEAAIRSVVEGAGVSEPTVVRYGEDEDRTEYLIRFAGDSAAQGEQQGQLVDRLQAALQEKIGPVTVDRVEFVGPKVGADLRRDGIKAMLIAFVLILVYVAFRFTPRFAPGAVIALIHDVLVTSAIWILLGQQFDLQVLAALLALVGYSINDTIIIYDRIRENMAVHTSHDLAEVINRSVNQTLSRTVMTSGLTMVSVLALLALGGAVIFPFAAAMAIGIVVGTYSSVYIASPIMLVLERRYGTAGGGAASAGKGGGKGSGKRGADKGARAARA